MKKIILSLILILCFSSAMAKARLSVGGDNSGGGYNTRYIHGGDSGDLYIIGGDATGGGRLNSGEGGGDSPAHK